MELRAYAKVLWRRIWVVLLIVGVVAIYVAYQYYSSHKAISVSRIYHASVSIRIGLQAAGRGAAPTYADYVTTVDTLADEFATGPTLTSRTFATQVSQQIQNDMQRITQQYGSNADLGNWRDATGISSALTATRSHSVVTINVTWNTEAGAWAIAHAIGEVSTINMPTYLDYNVGGAPSSQESYPTAAARVLNETNTPILVQEGSSTSRTTLLLALLLVGLILGVALAFLVEYLDDRIHSADEVTNLLQLPIYGEVPSAPPPGSSRVSQTRST